MLNYGRPGRGPKLRKGLALAVEPMLTLGSRHTRRAGRRVDRRRPPTGGWAAHFEHTVALTERGPWVLTALDGGAERLGRARRHRRLRADSAQLAGGCQLAV